MDNASKNPKPDAYPPRHLTRRFAWITAFVVVAMLAGWAGLWIYERQTWWGVYASSTKPQWSVVEDRTPAWLKAVLGDRWPNIRRRLFGECTTLYHDNCTGGDLEVIGTWRELESLDLRGPGVTDAGLIHLKGLPNLSTLKLSGADIGDAGLEHLKALPSLSQLKLRATKVTEQGVNDLADALPLLDIDHIDYTKPDEKRKPPKAP